ncbi:sensor histidine kinase [Seonamhaeicola sp.]|uniref:tetratricopeptide repeat-containing sensor histidine kinase n=1 Tax=Seonamhaeicola sp. TaxID=1912245 RepID=UPI0026247BF5|nr:sensor histidine kinase [Seonamhaeicola sp.]
MFSFFWLAIPAQDHNFGQVFDSIQHLHKLSDDQSLDLDARLLYAKKASELSYKTRNDSITLKSNETLSKAFWENNMFDEYRNLNRKNLELAIKVKDSSSIGRAHLNLGDYYRKKTPYSDSAFYQYHVAEKIYRDLGIKFQLAKAILGKAVIKKEEKDFTGSEVDSFEALTLLKSLPQNDKTNTLKSLIFNHLGIVNVELGLYKEAIKYHNKALLLKKNLNEKSELSIYISLNNISYTYKKLGKFKLALNHFDQILKDENVRQNHVWLYVLALENYAHTLFLSKQYEQLPYLYHKTLKIADAENVVYETIIAHQHLAEYYYHFKQKDSAKFHAYKAKEKSEQYYADDLLKSLLVLSKVEDDSIAVKHYAEYIKLNDSIQKNERLTRNKFARIRFETDTYIDKTKRLSSQNTVIIAIGLVIVLVLGLLYIIKIQHSKNEKLRFVSAQQVANEEIYSLMLRQQAKVEEGRLQERHHIAEELHDGILNRLTGSRLGLEFLFYDDAPVKVKYKPYLNEFQSIEKDIRDLSHNLKNTKLNLNGDFISIIKTYLKPLCELHQLNCEVTNDQTIFWEDINDIIKVNLYRIVQEATQNTIKHAKATNLLVSFLLINTHLQLEIRDDGTGFNPQKPAKGIGLKNIASRVEKLKGTLDINSEVKKGTILTITIPM